MLVKILIAGPYSDYGGPKGNRRACLRQPGDLVDFPDVYAKALEKSGMAEIHTVEAEVVIPFTNGIDATTSAVEYATEHDLDITGLVGSGVDGRITLNDVRRLVRLKSQVEEAFDEIAKDSNTGGLNAEDVNS